MPKHRNRYHPFIDIDNNGTILITPLQNCPDLENEIYITNISGEYNGKGLPKAKHMRCMRFDFKDVVVLGARDIQDTVDAISMLYRNELDAISINHLPGMNYGTFEPRYKKLGALQWGKDDLCKIIMHVRQLAVQSSAVH